MSQVEARHIWFTGTVAEAVKAVTEKNRVFLVFLYNDSQESKQLDAEFQYENLVSIIESKAIALKMQENSEEAKLFGQLYPTSQVPAVYFILQGTIKDYGIHDLKSKDIIDKINQCSPKIDTRKNFNALEKRLEDETQAKDRKSKRREDGKLAQETRQNLQDQQDKLCLKQLKKERKSNEENERKVKEQIAKDRAIQIAERKAEKQHTEEGKKHVQQSPSKRYYDHSNLNIKQIDGSSLRHSFSSSNTLANVTGWIDNVRTDGDMPYKLFAQFPNRNFEIGDEQKTLMELKLCPSGTLIMKPIKNASTAYAGAPSSISSKGWMNYLYSASDKIYNSVSQAGASVVNYLVTPTAAPEHGRRLGGSSSSSSNATASSPSLNLDRSTSNHHNRNINNSSSKKTDGATSKNRQTYNGNSVNYE